MIRVLIVDDSPTARAILSNLFAQDSDFEIVGTARDGREGVELTRKLRPDLITMDIQMPVMDGFEATKEIMIEVPTPIVIVSASTRLKEVDTGMKALAAGALTLLRKPSGPNSPNYESEARAFLRTVKSMSDVKVIRHRRGNPVAKVVAATNASSTTRDGSTATVATPSRIRVIAIAASTGGPPALQTLLGGLPKDFPLPILLVQHIAEGFSEGFAQWLNSVAHLHVKIAQDHELVKPGTVYVAPQDVHLGIDRAEKIQLCKEAAVGGFRPAATVMFSSVAAAYRNQSISVILTGMGQDGVQGLQQVYDAGGITIAQDEATSVVFGMPRVAIERNIIREVLPIHKIAQHLVNLVAQRAS